MARLKPLLRRELGDVPTIEILGIQTVHVSGGTYGGDKKLPLDQKLVYPFCRQWKLSS